MPRGYHKAGEIDVGFEVRIYAVNGLGHRDGFSRERWGYSGEGTRGTW